MNALIDIAAKQPWKTSGLSLRMLIDIAAKQPENIWLLSFLL